MAPLLPPTVVPCESGNDGGKGGDEKKMVFSERFKHRQFYQNSAILAFKSKVKCSAFG
jgi:hypothetical protein